MALDALIFDMDGTLLDTNAAHVDAWVEGLARHGYRIPPARIRPGIGMGGDQLLPSLLGDELDEAQAEAIRASVAEAFRRMARERHFRPFDDALRLLDDARERGLRLALATSASEEDLDAIMRSAGIDLRERFDAVVTKSDVDRSKPAPDVVLAATQKLDLSPAQCAMVGDTPYDATSARRAGVVTLGVLSGGLLDERTCRARLVAAGARGIWCDVGALRRELDAALHLASPARVRLTSEVQERLMHEALLAAREGLAVGEAPIGCAIADGDGDVLARAHNEEQRTGVRTSHAEMVAFTRLGRLVSRERSDLLLISTLEPCVMCTGAAMVGAVDTVVFGMRAPADGGAERVTPAESPASQVPRIVGEVLSRECRALVEEWMEQVAEEPQASYGRQLLAVTTRDGSAREAAGAREAV